MSLNPTSLEAAMRRNDVQAVRELLRDATEADRAACAKAIKSFLTAPKVHLPGPVMLSPQRLMDFPGSGYQRKPAAVMEQEQQQAERGRDYDAWQQIARGLAFRAAQFGLVGGVAAATRLARDFYDTGHDHDTDRDDAGTVAVILADRRPAWLADFVDRHLRQWPFGLPAWPLARALVRLGVIPRPEVPEYITLMPGSACRRKRGADGRWISQTPAEALLSDPGLLDDEVWRLFTVPDAAYALEKARSREWTDGAWVEGQTWAEGIAELTGAGLLDRDRLLDACLDAFTRDFNPNRVGWYANLLNKLEPWPDEMAARGPGYLRLLSANARDAVKVGQAAVGRLLAAGRLDGGLLLDESAPALRYPQKSIAAAQLKLIGQVAATDPGLRARAAATAAAAFGHERQDVQEAALKLIGKLGVPGEPFLSEIRAQAVDLAPSLRADAAALGLGSTGGMSTPHGTGTGGHVRVSRDASHAGPRPGNDLAGLEQRIAALPASAAGDARAALELVRAGGVPGSVPTRPAGGAVLPAPVTDPEELVQLLTVLLEDRGDAIVMERALAGAVRLSALPTAQRARLVAPLLKPARQCASIFTPFSGGRITSDIALITLTWSGEKLREKHRDRENSPYNPGWYAVASSGRARTMAGIFSARAWEAARIIEAGRGGLLLAEPETERGTVTAGTLLRRIRDLAAGSSRPAGGHDRDVALLRLEPGEAGELWQVWEPAAGVSAKALRVSHEQVQVKLTFEAVTGMPTGEPIRRQLHDHVLARIVGPVPRAQACDCWELLTDLPDPLAQHEVLYGPARFQSGHLDPAVAAWPLICPWQPELAAAHLLRALSDGLVPGLTPAATALEGMRHPGHVLGPVGHLGLVVGLASAEADTRIAAAQLWSDACLDGRLDPALAAAAIATGVRGGVIKLSRVADALQHASHAPLPARRIVETVCAAMDSFAPYAPTNLHLLIELAAQLVPRVGAPELPAMVLDLAGRRGDTRVATTAAQLTRERESAGTELGTAAAQALAAHVARAEAGELVCQG
jgi:Family of unknown function (DUF6493)